MIREITIINKLGLHARAAAKLVECAKQFQSDISLSKDGEVVDAKSILGILMLAAAKGSQVTINAEGPDEMEALNQIEALILNRFGEGE